jgi:MFS family permease
VAGSDVTPLIRCKEVLVLLITATGFAAYYATHGATWPLLSAVLHTRVGAAHRATAVSAMSLAVALGGIVGNLAISALAAAVSTEAAFGLLAVVLLFSAGACLRLPQVTTAAVPERAREPIPVVTSEVRNARDTPAH